MLSNLLSLGVLYLVGYESNKRKKKYSNIKKRVDQKLSVIPETKLTVIYVISLIKRN